MNFKSGTQTWTWDMCLGRDGDAMPDKLPHLVHEAINVELQLDGLPRRRAGSVKAEWQGGLSYNGFVKIGRYFGTFFIDPVPHEYLFWTDQGNTHRITRYDSLASTVIAPSLVPADTFVTPNDAQFCQFNGKMYRPGSSNIDRLHVMDPRESGNSTAVLRRVGVVKPTGAGAQDVGSGGYTGFRYYRLQFKVISAAGVTLRQSNLGDPQGWNPIGTGSAVRVFQPGAGVLGEAQITHWVVFASPDNALYYNISGDIPIATASFDDTIAVANYPNYVVAPEEGAYNTWPSVKFLLNGIDRLIGFGAHGGADGRGGNVSTPGRVWFSPVLGTSATEDDERVPVVLAGSNPIQNWIDVGRGTGETDAGLGGPIDGQALVFQSRGVYLLIPTGNVYAPFKRVTVSTDVGAVEGSIFNGQDEYGRPAVYWMDATAGPYRYGAEGLQWLGYDVRAEIANWNRLAPEFLRAHGVFHNQTQTAYFWIAQGQGVNKCNKILKFNARMGKDTGATGVRYGWSIDTGDFATANGSAILRRTGFAPPYNGFEPLAAIGSVLLVRNITEVADLATPFQSSVRSKVIDFTGAPFQVKQIVTDWLYLQGNRVNTPIQVSLFRNFSDQVPAVAAKSCAPPAQYAEDRVILRFEGLQLQDAWAVQVQISDRTAVNATGQWQVDYVSLPVEIRTQERWNVSA